MGELLQMLKLDLGINTWVTKLVKHFTLIRNCQSESESKWHFKTKHTHTHTHTHAIIHFYTSLSTYLIMVYLKNIFKNILTVSKNKDKLY